MASSTSSWLNGISGDWSAAANWSPAGAPNNTDTDVLIGAIPVGGTPYIVTIATATSFSVAGVTLDNADATLRVNGTLAVNGGTLAATRGTIALNNGIITGIGILSGLLTGRGSIIGTGTISHTGTIIADRTSNTLTVAAPLLNSGTLMSAAADGGSVLLLTGSLANWAAGTLTGGTFMAAGSAAAQNSLRLRSGGGATPVTTNAAHLVLDGRSAAIEVFNGTGFESIGVQLHANAAAGTLEIRNHKNLSITGTLSNAGTVMLQNGTLTTPLLANSGTVSGFGSVKGTIANAGTILVSGGALHADETITGTGSIQVGAGARLILEGAAPGSLHNDGTVFNAQGLLNLGAITGTGRLVVENGATLTLGQATSQTVTFGGANATLRLDAPATFTGTLTGFGAGDMWFGPDRLILTGVSATAATVVNTNTLAVISGGTTIQTIALAGTYAGASFSVSMDGADAVIVNTAGAPARNGLSATITVNDLAAIDSGTEAQIVSNLEAALADWGRYITGHAPLRIALTLSPTTSGSRLAEAQYTSTILTGETISGKAIAMPSSIYALTTGNTIAGTASDIAITLYLGGSNLANLFIDPDPYDSGSVPLTQFDLTTVFRHELGHGLGMYGLTNPTTGALGSQATLYDINMSTVLNSGTVTSASFTGAYAMAAYGTFLGSGTATAIPLTAQSGAQNLYHFGTALASDLMNGIGIATGTSIPISMLDLAVLRDVGVPITAGIVCYARGTRIATPSGERPIETLIPGDAVLVQDRDQLRVEPVRWIGHRSIDLTRHPQPWRVAPIRIRRDALAPGVPRRDLLVSPPHGILIGEALVPAMLLVNHMTILREDTAARIDYFHLELDRHAILRAEGLAAESYLDTGNRAFFANGGQVAAAHPVCALPPEARWATLACAPLVTDPARVRPLWQSIADRACTLGHQPVAWTLTQEPALHLIAAGRPLAPVSRQGPVYVFAIPPDVGTVRLMSRHAIPAEVTPWLDDTRRLGVAITRLRFHAGPRSWDMAPDDPALSAGWHAPERAGPALWRWTDGDAELPLPELGPMLLELRTGPTLSYVLARTKPPVRQAA